MKKTVFLVLVTLFVVGVTAPMAMSHGDKDSKEMNGMKMDGHGDMKDHGGMEGMTDQMIMLGTATQDGVKAKAHIMDVSAKMAEAGKSETHHIMAAFESADGAKVLPKVIAVKVTSPSGKSGKAAKMMGMEGLYGVNVELQEKGTYTFTIVAKLESGKKVKYTFTYDYK